nr:aspartate:alanine exchanger family transporter [Rubrivirga marina]
MRLVVPRAPMVALLTESPVLLLVVVAALGYVLGRIRVLGTRLGVAAVLFAGLGVGALDPALALPEFTVALGLVLFVYTIGLSSGPGFFASFRRKGVRDNVLAVGVLLGGAGLAAALAVALDLPAAVATGMYTGATTNTPALAAVLDYVASYVPPDVAARIADEPVVGYSLAYPVGVVGSIVAIAVAQRAWRIDYAAEAARVRGHESIPEAVDRRTVRVTRPEATEPSVGELADRYGGAVRFGRVQREGQRLPAPGDHLREGDLVSVVGAPDALDRVAADLGAEDGAPLVVDRGQVDYRRVFVSSHEVAGRRIGDLGLMDRFGAVVTRVRRGDVEWLARDDTVLEPGDRVRVVAPTAALPAVSRFFGDSYKALSEIDLLTFSLGLAAGLLVGLVPVPLPGGLTFRLGLAGGPLVVGLVLGTLGRTGPLVWHLPYSGNLVLRQFGLVLFFAGIGTRSGHTFLTTLTETGGAAIVAAGAAVTFASAVAALWIGRKVLRMPMGLLIGIVAGIQSQPAVLSYALDQSGDDLPNVGYTTVFPVAIILKILLAQILLASLL